MKKSILVFILCIITIVSGCSGGEQNPFLAQDHKEVIIEDLVFQFPKSATIQEYDNKSLKELDLNLAIYEDKYYYLTDESGVVNGIVSVQTATGEDTELKYNETVEKYSDPKAYFEKAYASAPELIPDTEYIVENTKINELNGIACQLGDQWIVEHDDGTMKMCITACIIDDTYYCISYSTTPELYDSEYIDGFISCIKKQ